MAKRAAGFLIFRNFDASIEYLLLKASYGKFHWTPPKGINFYWKTNFFTKFEQTIPAPQQESFTPKDSFAVQFSQSLQTFAGPSANYRYFTCQFRRFLKCEVLSLEGQNMDFNSKVAVKVRCLQKSPRIPYSRHSDHNTSTISLCRKFFYTFILLLPPRLLSNRKHSSSKLSTSIFAILSTCLTTSLLILN